MLLYWTVACYYTEFYTQNYGMLYLDFIIDDLGIVEFRNYYSVWHLDTENYISS